MSSRAVLGAQQVGAGRRAARARRRDAFRIGAAHRVGERDVVQIVGRRPDRAEIERLVAEYAGGAREEIPLV